MENSSVILLVVAIAGGLFLLWIILYLIPVGLWFQALVSDVKISLLQLVLMRWRKVPPTVIVSAMIEGKKAGIELYRDLLEGFVIYGALIGGFIGIVLYCRIRKIMLLAYLDLALPSVALAQGFGRIGCLLTGCFLRRRLSGRCFFSLSVFICNLIQLRLLLADQITDLICLLLGCCNLGFVITARCFLFIHLCL